MGFTGDILSVGGGIIVTVTGFELLIGDPQAKFVPVQVTSKVAEVRVVLSGGLTVGLVQLVQDSQERVPGVCAVQDTVPPLLGIWAFNSKAQPALIVAFEMVKSAIEVIL